MEALNMRLLDLMTSPESNVEGAEAAAQKK